MDENQWLEQLKDRADQTVLRDVQFTSVMEKRVRQRINKKTWFQSGWGLLSYPAVVVLLFVLIWQIWPARIGEEHAAQPAKPAPSLLPGGVLETPVLWIPSTQTKSSFDGQPFTYLGEKPVRIIADENGFYEGQTQRIVWLLDGSYASKVEIIAYSSEGSRIPLGTYQVMDPLFDAKGHFPSGIALPDPGVWKLQVVSDGKHLGQVFVEVKSGISPANRLMVEPLIRDFLKVEGEKLGGLGNDRDITLDLLGVEAPSAEQRTVYAWVTILGQANNSGISAPMVFQINYDGKAYRVKDFKMPEDGSNYQSSLQKLFPPKVLERIRNR
ncbi:hypothetical protein [Brevibacillus sp. NRS-1366]|uniref:hypothetical protein n=1 Tax=Brevibacillus sp. NRS-1366 TaxID=3233899 RepID=UPI003D1C51B2